MECSVYKVQKRFMCAAHFHVMLLVGVFTHSLLDDVTMLGQ
jgi:hypothetical protein